MISSIQILRAIAALSVVLYHLLPKYSWGQYGVDIFFIISGFVMVASTNEKEITGREFFTARVIRVVPLWWVCLTGYIFLKYLNGITFNISEIIRSYFFIFFKNSNTGEPVPILVPGWTLNYEMYFYSLFALSIFIFKLTLNRILFLSLCFLTLFLGRFILSDIDNAFLFRMTSPLPLEFVGGMFLAFMYPKIRHIHSRVGVILSAIGVALIMYSGIPKEPRFIMIGFPAALIVLGFLILESQMNATWLKPLKIVGDSSYSLYLTHSLVLYSRTLFGFGHATTGLDVFLSFILCIFVGVVCFYAIERPLFTKLKFIYKTKQKKNSLAVL